MERTHDGGSATPIPVMSGRLLSSAHMRAVPVSKQGLLETPRLETSLGIAGPPVPTAGSPENPTPSNTKGPSTIASHPCQRKNFKETGVAPEISGSQGIPRRANHLSSGRLKLHPHN
jgi:hypothetical protein